MARPLSSFPSVSGSIEELGRMDSRSSGMGTEKNEAWSRRDRAILQKRSC